MTMFMECLYRTSVECLECKGTGRRGAKLNGKKICKKCDGNGQLPACDVNSRGDKEPCQYCPTKKAER